MILGALVRASRAGFDPFFARKGKAAAAAAGREEDKEEEKGDKKGSRFSSLTFPLFLSPFAVFPLPSRGKKKKRFDVAAPLFVLALPLSLLLPRRRGIDKEFERECRSTREQTTHHFALDLEPGHDVFGLERRGATATAAAAAPAAARVAPAALRLGIREPAGLGDDDDLLLLCLDIGSGSRSRLGCRGVSLDGGGEELGAARCGGSKGGGARNRHAADAIGPGCGSCRGARSAARAHRSLHLVVRNCPGGAVGV